VGSTERPVTIRPRQARCFCINSVDDFILDLVGLVMNSASAKCAGGSAVVYYEVKGLFLRGIANHFENAIQAVLLGKEETRFVRFNRSDQSWNAAIAIGNVQPRRLVISFVLVTRSADIHLVCVEGGSIVPTERQEPDGRGIGLCDIEAPNRIK